VGRWSSTVVFIEDEVGLVVVIIVIVVIELVSLFAFERGFQSAFGEVFMLRMGKISSSVRKRTSLVCRVGRGSGGH
jgi:hypothetical protein